MKKVTTIILTAIIAILSCISVFGEDAKGVIKDGRVLVPVRGVFENLGFTVDWNDAENKATISDDTHAVSLIKGVKWFKADGKEIFPDVPQQIIDGNFYLPLRAIGDAIGAQTSWDSNTQTAQISYNYYHVFIQCVPVKETSQVTKNQTASAKQSQTFQANCTGIIINYEDYKGKESFKLIPLSVMNSFGFYRANEISKFDITDGEYLIERELMSSVLYGHYKITKDGSFLDYIYGPEYSYGADSNGIPYAGVPYLDAEKLCDAIGAAYSWDKNNQVIHISYKGKDTYIKLYTIFDMSMPYPYNVPNFINVDNSKLPESIGTNGPIHGYSYFYTDYLEYLDVYFDYIDLLMKNGFTVTEMFNGDKYDDLKYKLNKGNVEVLVNGYKYDIKKNCIMITIKPQ